MPDGLFAFYLHFITTRKAKIYDGCSDNQIIIAKFAIEIFHTVKNITRKTY